MKKTLQGTIIDDKKGVEIECNYLWQGRFLKRLFSKKISFKSVWIKFTMGLEN